MNEPKQWILLPFPYSETAAHIGPFDSREDAEMYIDDHNLAYVAVPLDPVRYEDGQVRIVCWPFTRPPRSGHES